jgi:hypothetical protein
MLTSLSEMVEINFLCVHKADIYTLRQCCESMTFWCGSGSGDPAVHASDYWIRIRIHEAQRHVDSDPDPQHYFASYKRESTFSATYASPLFDQEAGSVVDPDPVDRN